MRLKDLLQGPKAESKPEGIINFYSPQIEEMIGPPISSRARKEGLLYFIDRARLDRPIGARNEPPKPIHSITMFKS